MTVKGSSKRVIGDDTPTVRARRHGAAKGRVKEDGKVLPDRVPPEVAAAMEATEEAVDHMMKVAAETANSTVREHPMSAIIIGESKDSGAVTHEALAAFIAAVEEVAGGKGISVEAARRAGLVAAAATAWEDALGPQLDTAHVREMLGGVSKQRINELLRQHRLIGLQASNARWKFPAFQFTDGRLPTAKLAEAFWQLSTRAVDPWSAASWCVSPNSQLDGRTPVDVAATDAELVATVGERDADRLSR